MGGCQIDTAFACFRTKRVACRANAFAFTANLGIFTAFVAAGTAVVLVRFGVNANAVAIDQTVLTADLAFAILADFAGHTGLALIIAVT